MYVETKSKGLAGLARARYSDVLNTAVNGSGRGFIPPTVTVSTMPEPTAPATPTFTIEDSKFGPTLVIPPTTEADTRSATISEPIPGADAKLAFEINEAKKYGYTHSAWMALGPAGRSKIRQIYSSGNAGTTSSGSTIENASVDFAIGRDPLRSLENASGAGEYPGGIEIAEPQPNADLVQTPTGVRFADLVQIDPVKVETAGEGDGLPTQDLVRWGIMAAAAWILFDAFKPKRKTRRRRYPLQHHSKRFRQGWQ